jgi:hypothetical protein
VGGSAATIVLLAAVALSPALRRTLGTVSLPAVHGVQVYRAIGAIFLVLMGPGPDPGALRLAGGMG